MLAQWRLRVLFSCDPNDEYATMYIMLTLADGRIAVSTGSQPLAEARRTCGLVTLFGISVGSNLHCQ
jgi:hypothetical protein